MRGYKRSERVGQLMLREISDIIHRRLKDPNIGFCTVTRVIVSDDLQHAKVYVSAMGSSEESETTLQALERATNFVRREVGQRLRIRHTPEITFHPDRSIEHLDHIDRLLRQLSEETAIKDE